jgi:hypothetical protein
MGQINDHVIVKITREAAKLIQQGFGIPMALCTFHTSAPVAGVAFSGRYKVYKSTTEVKNDFTDNATITGKIFSREVITIANRIFGQDISPSALIIGRRTPGTAIYTVTIGGTIVIGEQFSVTINAVKYTYTAAVATVADVSAGLATLVNADLTQNVTADGSTTAGTLLLTADANSTFTVKAAIVRSVAGTVTIATGVGYIAPEDASTAVDAVLVETNSWYGLIHGFFGQIDKDSDTDVLDIAESIEGIGSDNPKLYGSCTNTLACANLPLNETTGATDLANKLHNKAYDRTYYVYSDDAESYPHAAWMGLQLPKPPGSSTWKFKQVSGITPTALTTTQRSQLLAKKSNFFETVAGINMFASEGTVVSGEYIDIIMGIDWLRARISERVFTVLANAEKVPITNAGITTVAKEVDAQLQIAAGPQINFVDGSTIVVKQPDVSQLDPTDKANRILNGITFTAELQGAVHKVYIDGFLSI